MDAYVRRGQVGADTQVSMQFGYESIFPALALEWLKKNGIGEFFMEGDKLILKFTHKSDAEELALLWNSRN